MVQVGPMVPWFIPTSGNRLIHLLVMIVGHHWFDHLLQSLRNPGVAKLTQRMDSFGILQGDGSEVKHASFNIQALF